MIELKPTIREHLPAIAEDMRAMDAEECRLTGGHTPLEALEFSLAESDVAYTAIVDGVPMIAFGIVYDVTGNSGIIWALGTKECHRHPVSMVRWGRKICEAFLEMGERWSNTVLADYTQCLKYLKMIGFEVADDDIPCGGKSFRSVVLRRK